MSVWFSNNSKEGIFKGATSAFFWQTLTLQKQHMVGNLSRSAGSQKCHIKIHVQTWQCKCTQNVRLKDISNLCFEFLWTWNGNLTHDTEAVLSFHASGAKHRWGATSEARSDPTGRATHVLLHQDMLCCTPPQPSFLKLHKLNCFVDNPFNFSNALKEGICKGGTSAIFW